MEEKGKLSLKYIGPYEILERVEAGAYKLRLLTELSRIHNIFHVSMLRKYVLDSSHILREQPIKIKEDFTYEERPLRVLDHKEQVLRTKVFSLVKVLGDNHGVKEAIWKSEELIKAKYPQLFT